MLCCSLDCSQVKTKTPYTELHTWDNGTNKGDTQRCMNPWCWCCSSHLLTREIAGFQIQIRRTHFTLSAHPFLFPLTCSEADNSLSAPTEGSLPGMAIGAETPTKSWPQLRNPNSSPRTGDRFREEQAAFQPPRSVIRHPPAANLYSMAETSCWETFWTSVDCGANW